MGRKRIFYGSKSEYMKEYRQRPEYRQSLKERRKRPDQKEYNKAYLARPEVKERYRQASRERGRKYAARRRQDPDYMARQKELESRPHVRERRNYLKRLKRSGLPEELFAVMDLSRRLKAKINELRNAPDNAL